MIKAIGQQLVCVHVNHGLLRKGRARAGDRSIRNQMNAYLVYVDVTDRFLDKLAGVEDRKRRVKLSVENLLKYLLKKQESLMVLNS